MSNFKWLNVAIILGLALCLAVADAQMRRVTGAQFQMSPILPGDVRTTYTGNRNYGRPTVLLNPNFYRDFLYSPDTSYFKYPFFHVDYSPTNYINELWTTTSAPAPASAPEATTATEVRPWTWTEPDRQEAASEDRLNQAPQRGTRNVNALPYPYPDGYPYPYPYPQYNYGNRNGNGNSIDELRTTAAPRKPQVIDDNWNAPRPTTTEGTLRADWFPYQTSKPTSTEAPQSQPLPEIPDMGEGEGGWPSSRNDIEREWESVPTLKASTTTTTTRRPITTTNTPWTTTATPYTTTTAMKTTTTTTTTPITTTDLFETEDEIKAEGEGHGHGRDGEQEEESGPRDENEDDDSDEDDDDDDEDEWPEPEDW